MKKSVCGDDTLKNGRHAVALQARVKCFVLRIRVYYVSVQFNSVVCNYGLFELICNVTNRFGQWCVDFLKYSIPEVSSYSGPPCTCDFGIRKKIRCGLRFLAYFCAVLRFSDPPLRLSLFGKSKKPHTLLRIDNQGTFWPNFIRIRQI